MTPPHCFCAFQRLVRQRPSPKPSSSLLGNRGQQGCGMGVVHFTHGDCPTSTSIEHKSSQQAYGTEAIKLFALPRFPGEEGESKTLA